MSAESVTFTPTQDKEGKVRGTGVQFIWFVVEETAENHKQKKIKYSGYLVAESEYNQFQSD